MLGVLFHAHEVWGLVEWHASAESCVRLEVGTTHLPCLMLKETELNRLQAVSYRGEKLTGITCERNTGSTGVPWLGTGFVLFARSERVGSSIGAEAAKKPPA